jgi:Txe/YoeB family toxin of toxin-antitoxin system
MRKLLVCLPASLLLALGINYSNYRNYYDSLYKVQTVDINILANLLPTKLSLALINKDKNEIQRTIDSNYGYFGIVVTSCQKSTKECSQEKIIARSQPQRVGWKEKVVTDKLSNYPHDILRDPLPVTAEIKFQHSRSTELTSTGKINKGKPIGRVYYIRRDPINFWNSQWDWICQPFKAANTLLTTNKIDLAYQELQQFSDNGANNFYVLTNTGFIFLGLFIWQTWERNEEKRKRIERNIKQLKTENEKLVNQTKRLQSNIQEFKNEKISIEQKSNQIQSNLKSLLITTNNYEKDAKEKENEIKRANEQYLQVTNQLKNAIEQYELQDFEENSQILVELEKQKQILSDREIKLQQDLNLINHNLNLSKAEVTSKEIEIKKVNLELEETKSRLNEAEEQNQLLKAQQGKYDDSINGNKPHENKIAELQIELSISRDKLNEFIENFDPEKKALEGKNNDLKSKITNLQKCCDMLNTINRENELNLKNIEIARTPDFKKEFRDDWDWWDRTDLQKTKKIFDLVTASMSDPFRGIGKPEPLKFDNPNTWSRRIDQEHRLVYEINNDRITFFSCRGHYDDN